MTGRTMLSLASSLAVVVASGGVTAHRSAAGAPSERAVQEEAERYFACPQGFAFGSRDGAAHCKKPGSVDRVPLNNCPNVNGVGLFASVDRVRTKDMCAGTNPITGEIAVERSCPTGFDKRIVRGTDRCERRHPAEIIAPSVAVMR